MATYFHILGHGNSTDYSKPHRRTVLLRSMVGAEDTVEEVRYDCSRTVSAQLDQINMRISRYMRPDPVLVGHSLGGFYAFIMARHLQIKRMILLNPSLFPGDSLRKQLGEDTPKERRVTLDQLADWVHLSNHLTASRAPATGVALFCEGDDKLRQYHPRFSGLLQRMGMTTMFAAGGDHSNIPAEDLLRAIEAERLINQ